MRIAVTYANGEIFQHFGRTEQFKVYDVENGQVLRSQVVGTGGQGHGALAGVLQQLGADVLICGGIGGGAQAALASAGLVRRVGVTVPDTYSALAIAMRSDMATLIPRRLALLSAESGRVRLIDPPYESPIVDVTVDCSDGPARGRTVTRLEGEWGTWPDREGARHRVVMEVEPGFEERMIDLLAAAR